MQEIATAIENLIAAIDAAGLGTSSGDFWHTFRGWLVRALNRANGSVG